MPKYDYTNATIDKTDKKRLHFYEELLSLHIHRHRPATWASYGDSEFHLLLKFAL